MAITVRTITEIEEAMIADKESRTNLDSLNSTSNASIWRNLIYSFATSSYLNEISMKGFQDEVEVRSLEIPTGTARWYAAESLEFQYGDTLTFTEGNVVYTTDDDEKKIIKVASADKENGFLVIKVAKYDVADNAIALSDSELLAFKEYWNNKAFACTPISFVSQESDKAIITYRIGVDATIIDPTTGESITTSGTYPVEDAINEFLKSFQSENFSSIFKIMKLTDAIQSVEGVNNAIANSVQVKPFDGIYNEITSTSNQEYSAQAGYITVSEEIGETLKDTLTYY